jgi:hypothetical protein
LALAALEGVAQLLERDQVRVPLAVALEGRECGQHLVELRAAQTVALAAGAVAHHAREDGGGAEILVEIRRGVPGVEHRGAAVDLRRVVERAQRKGG